MCSSDLYLTDRAHVTTYVDAVIPLALVAEKQKLDTMAIKRCDNDAAVANADNAGTQQDPQRYPQLFGSPGIANSDLCNASVSSVTIDPNPGVAGDEVVIGPSESLTEKIPFSEELSKNIAVVAYNCLGTTCKAPDLSTASSADSKDVVSPFFMPLVADFRTAPGQDYATSTLTLELVTQ